MFKTNMRVESFWFSLLLGLYLCLVCKADDNVSYEKMMLESAQEIGIVTDKNIIENSRRYYKQMFGEHFEYKKTGYIFLERACNRYPIAIQKMDIFKDMIFAPFTSIPDGWAGLPAWKRPYFPEKYWPDSKLMPSRYFLAKSQLLSDMLYWEWQVDNIQFRVLESNEGMLLWINPDGFDANAGISDKECAETLLKTTRIKCKNTDELCKRFKLPSTLREGDVFTNINNFEKLVNTKVINSYYYREFPIPTEPDNWSKQLVGFISKDGICLILVHGRFPIQSFPAKPTIMDDTHRWLSGRILYKSTKMPVLPRGVTKIPESWKPVLEYNTECEQGGLRKAERQRLEEAQMEAQWRVWHDKNGKPLMDGQKMKFDYWDKRPAKYSDYKAGTVILQIPSIEASYGNEFPLSEFSEEDKKIIMAVPPRKTEPTNEPTIIYAVPDEEKKPKEPEPVEEDDIE
jgi:hypothetical protein